MIPMRIAWTCRWRGRMPAVGYGGRVRNWGSWLLKMKGLKCLIWLLRLVWLFGGGGIIIEIYIGLGLGIKNS
mgnify:CR=1 FL=1|jgi:hypothetical protein